MDTCAKYHSSVGCKSASALALVLSCVIGVGALSAAEPPQGEVVRAVEQRPEKEVIEKFIVGRWELNTAIGGTKVFAITEMRKNGTLISSASYQTGKVKECITFSATWKVTGNKVRYRVTRSSEPSLIPVGEDWVDEILQIDDKVMTYRGTHGETWKETRIPRMIL